MTWIWFSFVLLQCLGILSFIHLLFIYTFIHFLTLTAVPWYHRSIHTIQEAAPLKPHFGFIFCTHYS